MNYEPTKPILPVNKEVELRLDELRDAITNIWQLKHDIGYFETRHQVRLELLSVALKQIKEM